MLTTEEMQRIVVEETTGGEQRVHGADADAFRAEIRREVVAAEEAGVVLEIPPEWPGSDG